MKIEVDNLSGKGGEFFHAYEPEEIVLDEDHARLTSPPQMHARITRRGQEITLRGSITARAEVDCDRCLKTIEVPVDANFEAAYISATSDAPIEDAELQDADLSVAVFDGETIDIDELVREQVLLALPLRALCTNECKGLCPVCGADKNTDSACACEETEIDPRWAALKNLRF